MKWQAYFQIFIIVFSIFVVYTPAVSAAQQVCCEKTKSGNSCLYSTQDQCDPRYKSAATNCEQTSFCKLGCGFDVFSGQCFRNTPKAACSNSQNCTWSEGTSCDVPTCQTGCCVLGSEASLTTQLACKATASKYPDVTMKFKPEITDELECINQVRGIEKGACVKPDNSCVFTTRDQCPETPSPGNPRLGFHPNMLCSNPTLQTNCAAEKYTGCLPDKDEVYWFDSCGNQENIYSSNKQVSYNNGFVLTKDKSCGLSGIADKNCGNCNFPTGTLCGLASKDQKPVYGDYTCQSLSCGTVQEEILAPAQDEPRKLGESWCAYDGTVGSGNDVVGSRHFRRMCINGKVIQEPCRDFREEICVQGVQAQPPLGFPQTFRPTGDYIESACRPNRFTDCLSITKRTDCEDIEQRDCYWAPAGINDPRSGLEAGVCVPEVPPGLKFWTGDAQYVPSADAGDVCAQGNQACQVTWYISGIAKYAPALASNPKGRFGLSKTTDWECVGNCACITDNWVNAASKICRSLGDCGINYNILGKLRPKDEHGNYNSFIETSDGVVSDLNPQQFVALGKRDARQNMGDFWKRTWLPSLVVSAFVIAAFYTQSTALLFPWLTQGLWYVQEGLYSTGAISTAPKATTATGAAFGETPYATATAAQQSELVKVATTNFQQAVATDTLTKSGAELYRNALIKAGAEVQADGSLTYTASQATVAQEAVGKSLAETSGQAPAVSPGWGAFWSVLNFVMILWLVYNLVDIFGQDIKQEPVTATCLPWQAPKGGSDCEKCGIDGKPCSEYRCRSLGASCKLINTGTENEKCVNQNPNDVNSPRIYANTTALQVGYTLTEVKNQGFTINQKIEPFTKVTLGISTDEPAICKFSLEHSKTFNEMPHPFGPTIYDYTHELQFSLPADLANNEEVLRLTNGGKYTIYARCEDSAGNDNDKDYYINFEIKPGPDYTAPTIELTSVVSGAYVGSGVSQIPFYAYLNEPAQCKWSTTDTDYTNMQNSFTCRTSGFDQRSIYYGLYECGTTLTGIQPKQVSTYYFRCKDQPLQTDESKRNVNKESYKFSLIGTEELKITSIIPSGLSYEPSPVLEVKTSGGAQNGLALCGFALGKSSTVQFLETNASTHKQPLTNILPGNYDISIECIDAGGNIAKGSTKLTTQTDTIGPKITQIYTEGNILKISTDEDSTCEYSNEAPFTYGQGTPMTGTLTRTHEATLVNKPYYVACKDKFDNKISVQVYTK